jgi:hypothetical protein
MIDDYERIYNAAIALNNTAIHLAQHGRYSDASETLQDAMKCTKVFCNGVAMSDIPLLMQRSEYNKALQVARDRKSAIQTGEYVATNTLHQNNILVVSDQDDPHEVCSTLERNRSLLCCVTIDPVEKFDMYDVDRLQLESALVVYNFGVVYRCIASRPVIFSHVKDSSISQSMSNFDVFCSSVRILELTRCVTTNLLSVSSCNGSRLLNLSSNLLLGALLVLTNLYQMSIESYCPHETEQNYLVELLNVLGMITEREIFLFSEGRQVLVALAA